MPPARAQSPHPGLETWEGDSSLPAATRALVLLLLAFGLHLLPDNRPSHPPVPPALSESLGLLFFFLLLFHRKNKKEKKEEILTSKKNQRFSLSVGLQ